MAAQPSITPTSSRPTKLWWLLGFILLGLFLVVQLPARWVVNKLAPNTPYLQQISGSLYRGQANWQLATQADARMPLVGTLEWRWQPWRLVTGKLGMHTDIRSDKTTLIGQVSANKASWQALDFSGTIATSTLKQLVNWQLPDAPIRLKDVNISRNKAGYQAASGSLSWAGGELGYPSGGKVYRINMPSMIGALSVDKAAAQPATGQPNTQAMGGRRLHLALTTPQGQRLGDIYLDNDNMVDVALTQRLMKNMPKYHGQGVDDSVVVSVRQPLFGSH